MHGITRPFKLLRWYDCEWNLCDDWEIVRRQTRTLWKVYKTRIDIGKNQSLRNWKRYLYIFIASWVWHWLRDFLWASKKYHFFFFALFKWIKGVEGVEIVKKSELIIKKWLYIYIGHLDRINLVSNVESCEQNLFFVFIIQVKNWWIVEK